MSQNYIFYITGEHPCSYIEGNAAKTVYLDPGYTPTLYDYQVMTFNGFRRSGNNLYTPRCNACQSCVATRVKIDEFIPSRRHTRILRKNADLQIEFKKAEFVDEHYQLYQHYINSRHSDGEMYPPSENQYKDFLFSKWAHTQLLEVRHEGVLLAVAATDFLEDGLSAIYTFFSPEHQSRSLGTYCILKQIEQCRIDKKDFLYLGFWVKQCRKMEYKTEYQPVELYKSGIWALFDPECDKTG